MLCKHNSISSIATPDFQNRFTFGFVERNKLRNVSLYLVTKGTIFFIKFFFVFDKVSATGFGIPKILNGLKRR
ncbi:MAG: hypothetical protein CMR00_06440 [[Chlorobium] sp. 445]|nr:MAG: hypothetical protein CMR00_06440 [[Chlorobium] sp. 445]